MMLWGHTVIFIHLLCWCLFFKWEVNELILDCYLLVAKSLKYSGCTCVSLHVHLCFFPFSFLLHPLVLSQLHFFFFFFFFSWKLLKTHLKLNYCSTFFSSDSVFSPISFVCEKEELKMDVFETRAVAQWLSPPLPSPPLWSRVRVLWSNKKKMDVFFFLIQFYAFLQLGER